MAPPWPRRCAATAALVVAGSAPSVLAWETASSFGLGAEYSDNIALVAENGEEAWVGLGTATVQVRDRTANMDARLAGMLEYRDYNTSLYDDEFLLSLDADAVWTMVPERYFWHVEDYYRQATTDVLAAPTPTNREDVNLFFTGPEGRWRMSPRTDAVAGGRYGHFWFEETDVDSRRLLAYARLEHDWRPRTRLSANAELLNTAYRSSRYEDYTRGDGFLRVEHTLSRAELTVDVGGTTVRRDQSDDLSGFLTRVAWLLPLNSYSTLEARAMAEYTDPGYDMLGMVSRGGIAQVDQQALGAVYYNEHAELAYHWTGVLFDWRAVVAARQEDYEDLARDRSYEEGHLRLGYQFSPTLRATLSGFYRRADYEQLDVTVEDTRAGFGLHYRINSRLRASLEIGRGERDTTGSDSMLNLNDYQENTAFISLTYERSAFRE